MEIKFTVFTPTYNRAKILSRSYEALCNQTYKKFIWLIVDDGSTDETEKVVKEWQNEKKIKIIYIKQKNMGKQRAVNTGIKNCKTDYFGFLDSDDYYKSDTVKLFLERLEKIKKNNTVAGICARRGTKQGVIIGNSKLPKEEFICNFDKVIRKYKFSGDTCRAYKTRILKDYLYPEINDKFILESVMLSAIDRKYDLYFVNEIFSISEYLEDGYTKNINKLYHKNPLGYALGINQLTCSNRGFLHKVFYKFQYIIWCKLKNIENSFELSTNKCMYILVYPISILFFKIRRPEFILKRINWMFREEKNG